MSKIPISEYPIYSKSNEKAKCILWEKAEQSGGKTQLEPVEHKLPIHEIAAHLMTCVEKGRESIVLGQWSDHMRKIDYYEQDLHTTIMPTDFSATLDLRAGQTDNCSINNHIVLDIYHVLNNFKNVRLANNEHAYMCDTAMFCCFG